jgi:PAS domain S-box-containing protein
VPDLSLLTALLGLGVAGIGVIGMFGLVLSLPLPAGAIAGYKPVSFSATIIWIIFGLTLVGIGKKFFKGILRTIVAGIIGLVVLIQLVEFPLNVLGDHFFIETFLVSMSSSLSSIPTTPVSPVTSGLIVPAGLALLLHLFAPELSKMHPRLRNVAGILGIIVSFTSFVFLMSYVYGAPFFYGTHFTPIAILSVLALFLTGAGLQTAAGNTAAPLKYFSGNSTHARLIRAFVPLVLGIILLDELIHILFSWFESVNDAILLAVIIAVFTFVTIIVVGQEARRVSCSIDLAESGRRHAEMELRASYEQLAAQEEELRAQYDDLAKSQQDLTEREMQYRTILKTAMDGFCLVDEEGRFNDVNDAFCSMLGYTREEMLKLSLHDIEAVESPEVIAMHMNRIIRQGSDRFETHYRCKGGRIIDAEVSVVYTGSPRAPFFTFHRDVTEWNRAEKAHELGKKKLGLLNLVTFSNIQNALFTMSGYLQLLKSEIQDTKGSGHVVKLEQSAGSISHNLEFAHKFQDMGMKRPVWQNVSQVFILAVSHLDLSKINRVTDIKDLEIFADPILEQAFLNLVKNSLDHGGTITRISLTATKNSDGTLTLVYTDNGIGIPQDKKGKMFARDFSDKPGMDLFLIREILEITGMSISENGEPGSGARFEMTVPKDAYRFVHT